MEETLGKRISANRKRLGMTQDRLAELLGVTAQAVSKWENDQSCPDISMLPKLAEIFGMSTDELLGLKPSEPRREETVHMGEVVEQPGKEENSGFEFSWDSGRKSMLGAAVWVLLTGAMLLAGNLLEYEFGFWECLWHTGLLTFGLFGLFPSFSVFRLACALVGGYFVAEDFSLLPFALSKSLILPILLLLLGVHLLLKAMKKSKKGGFRVTRNGKKMRKRGTAPWRTTDSPVKTPSAKTATGFWRTGWRAAAPTTASAS